MAKTLKTRIEDLENSRGDLPVMVFEQTWDDEDLFYLAGGPDPLGMSKSSLVFLIGR